MANYFVVRKASSWLLAVTEDGDDMDVPEGSDVIGCRGLAYTIGEVVAGAAAGETVGAI